MANTIGRVQGYTKRGDPKAGEATRLGDSVRVEGATWRTFVVVNVDADGRATVEVKRDGAALCTLSITREDRPASIELYDAVTRRVVARLQPECGATVGADNVD